MALGVCLPFLEEPQATNVKTKIDSGLFLLGKMDDLDCEKVLIENIVRRFGFETADCILNS